MELKTKGIPFRPLPLSQSLRLRAPLLTTTCLTCRDEAEEAPDAKDAAEVDDLPEIPGADTVSLCHKTLTTDRCLIQFIASIYKLVFVVRSMSVGLRNAF